MTVQSAISPPGTPRPSRTTLCKSAAYTHFIAMLTKCKVMTIDARVAMAKACMDEVVMTYKDNADAAIVDLTRQGRTCLLEHGLAVYEQVHSGQTVTHPWNRGHDVLEPADVPEKIAEISDIGWDLHKVADASAVRMPRDADKRKVIEDINHKLSEASDGLLPPVVPGMATIQVTACSHTSAGLKCANFGTKCDIARISESGIMSKAVIISRQPSMEEPIEKGIRYLVLETIVQEQWPAFIEMTIEAANASNNLAKPDTPLQLMLKAHRMALEAAKRGEPIDEKTILRKILRTKPAHPSDVGALIAYAVKWSGGDDPVFFNRFQKYAKQLRQVHRLKGEVMAALAAADMGTGRGGRYRCATMMCIATHDNIKTDHCKALRKGGKAEAALLAETQMLAFDEALVPLRSKVEGFNRDHDTILTLKSAEHDMQCVNYVHGTVKGKYSSLRDIAAKIFADVATTLGLADVRSPFVHLRSDKGPELKYAKVAPADTATSHVRLQQLTNDSTLANKASDLRAIIDEKFVKNGGNVRLQKSMAQEYSYNIASLDDITMTASLVKNTNPGSVPQDPFTVSYQSLCDDYIAFKKLQVRSPMPPPDALVSTSVFEECI